MFGAAIGVLVIEKPHAAVSSVPFQSAPIVLLVAGIVSILAGGIEIFVTKWGEATRDRVNKGSFKVSLSFNQANESFYSLRLSVVNLPADFVLEI